MNITLSIDEQVAQRARRAAQAMGKSLNQAVRDYLEQLAGRAQLEAEIAAYLESTARAPACKLLSEDMQSGSLIAGVRIVNPFEPSPHLPVKRAKRSR